MKYEIETADQSHEKTILLQPSPVGVGDKLLDYYDPLNFLQEDVRLIYEINFSGFFKLEIAKFIARHKIFRYVFRQTNLDIMEKNIHPTASTFFHSYCH